MSRSSKRLYANRLNDSMDASGYESSESQSLLGSVTVRTHPAPGGETSVLGAMFIVVNACIGAGLLNFPFAYQTAGGIAVSAIIQLVLVCIISTTLLILALCSDVRQSKSYQGVIQEMCGPIGRVICELCIIAYCFGTCITFFIIIGDQTDGILSYICGGTDHLDHWYQDRRFTITCWGIFIVLPLCMPKMVDFLKYPGSIGVFASLYICIVVIINYFRKVGSPSPDLVTHPSSWTQVFASIPTICFGFQCHVSIVPVYSSLHKRSLPRFSRVIVPALLISCTAYTLSGIFGSLTFGSKVCSDILLSYHDKNITIMIARVMALTNMLTTYPILHFCGRLAIETMLQSSLGRTDEEWALREKRRRVIETVTWFSISLLLALFIPDIGVVISVIGGLAAVFIFVFPGLCLVQFVLQHSAASRRKRWCLIAFGGFLLALGVFIFSESFILSIMNDISGNNKSGC
ncbi:sodium-coupled neutral amino acid transporter 7-like [Lytechinus pictus]|uniref:sodium-coupled neutral amino acid transporter 7-like n=1 Tax=Lytechinus pictus TaxID=7653 RepID=UPI0030B9D0F7